MAKISRFGSCGSAVSHKFRTVRHKVGTTQRLCAWQSPGYHLVSQGPTLLQHPGVDPHPGWPHGWPVKMECAITTGMSSATFTALCTHCLCMRACILLVIQSCSCTTGTNQFMNVSARMHVHGIHAIFTYMAYTQYAHSLQLTNFVCE